MRQCSCQCPASATGTAWALPSLPTPCAPPPAPPRAPLPHTPATPPRVRGTTGHAWVGVDWGAPGTQSPALLILIKCLINFFPFRFVPENRLSRPTPLHPTPCAPPRPTPPRGRPTPPRTPLSPWVPLGAPRGGAAGGKSWPKVLAQNYFSWALFGPKFRPMGQMLHWQCPLSTQSAGGTPGGRPPPPPEHFPCL